MPSEIYAAQNGSASSADLPKFSRLNIYSLQIYINTYLPRLPPKVHKFHAYGNTSEYIFQDDTQYF